MRIRLCCVSCGMLREEGFGEWVTCEKGKRVE